MMFSALETPFPLKVYAMLEDAEAKGFEAIVSWQPQGKSFKIHCPEIFESSIMPKYFAQGKFKSFQRQLNIYGWKKVQFGPNKRGYAHKHFIRGMPDLCKNVIRRDKRKKGFVSDLPAASSSKSSSTEVFSSYPAPNPEVVPAFTRNTIETLDDARGQSLELNEIEIQSFYNFFYPQDPVEKSHIDIALQEDEHDAACHEFDKKNGPRHSVSTITSGDCVTKFAAHLSDQIIGDDHAEQDALLSFSPSQPASSSSKRIAGEDGAEQKGVEDFSIEDSTSFPSKVYLMLENAERDNYAHIVSWVNGGTAFKVHNHDEFLKRVMPIYFDQSKYESFRRQLNLYNFSRVARGSDRGVISHPCLVAGAPWLCNEIKRGPKHDSMMTAAQA